MERSSPVKEARIRTEFGDIRIDFTTEEQLQAELDLLEAHVAQIQKTAGTIVPPLPRSPKPGFEYAYRFLPTGRVELLVFPDAMSKLVALALFAYFPDPVAVEEIETITGIENVYESVLKQSNNRKYFRKADEGYGITPEGVKLVLSSVPPRDYSHDEPLEQ